ncbi:MAG: hypothetical protein H7338_15320 [Candidatus Sericytochromatia bacterium]|nr:hypothetical protein [Candidatus Sericytochromatia bacterium]
MDLGAMAAFKADLVRPQEATAPTGRSRANAVGPGGDGTPPVPTAPTLTSGNTAQRSGDALRQASPAPSALGFLKQWVKGGGTPPAQVTVSAVQTTRTQAAVQPGPGFRAKATAFVSQSLAQTGKEQALATNLSTLRDGGSMSFEGEVSLGASLGIILKAVEGNLSGSMKAATAVSVECQGTSFLVTIQTRADVGVSAGQTGMGGLMTNVAGASRSVGMHAQMFLCDSPAAAAGAISAYHNGASTDLSGVRHLVQDHSAAMSGSNKTVTMTVRGDQKSTAVTGLFGRIQRAFTARVDKNVSMTTSRMSGPDATITKRTYEMASRKTGAGLDATAMKVLTLGVVSETRTASQVGLEVLDVASHTPGEAGAKKAEFSLKLDSSKIAALQTNFSSIGILADKETGRLVELMESANADVPGSFDVGPVAVAAIRDFVHTALSAVGEQGSRLRDRDDTALQVKVGGEVGGLDLEASATALYGTIVTIKLPFAEAPSGGFQPDFGEGEIGETRNSGGQAGARAGVDVGVTARVEVGFAAKNSTYTRFQKGSLSAPVLDEEALMARLNLDPSPVADPLADDGDDDVPPSPPTTTRVPIVLSQADIDDL